MTCPWAVVPMELGLPDSILKSVCWRGSVACIPHIIFTSPKGPPRGENASVGASHQGAQGTAFTWRLPLHWSWHETRAHCMTVRYPHSSQDASVAQKLPHLTFLSCWFPNSSQKSFTCSTVLRCSGRGRPVRTPGAGSVSKLVNFSKLNYLTYKIGLLIAPQPRAVRIQGEFTRAYCVVRGA